jgi:hypothetical protein
MATGNFTVGPGICVLEAVTRQLCIKLGDDANAIICMDCLEGLSRAIEDSQRDNYRSGVGTAPTYNITTVLNEMGSRGHE